VGTQVEERGAVRRRPLREDPEVALTDRTSNPHRDAEFRLRSKRQGGVLSEAYECSVSRVELKRAALCSIVAFDEGQGRAADNGAIVTTDRVQQVSIERKIRNLVCPGTNTRQQGNTKP
jgi:hypothetical protein